MRAIPPALMAVLGSEVIGSFEGIKVSGGIFDEVNVEVRALSTGSTHRGYRVSGRNDWFVKVYRRPLEGIGREARILSEMVNGCWVPRFGGAIVAVRDDRWFNLGLVQQWVDGVSVWDAAVAGGSVAVKGLDWMGLGASLRGLHRELDGVTADQVHHRERPEGLAAEIRDSANARGIGTEERDVLLEWARLASGLRWGPVPEEESGVIHGDLHLGQVLDLGSEGVRFIDLEGEPHVQVGDVRLLKESRLRDVAGMLRSIGYLGDVLGAGWSGRDAASLFLSGYQPEAMHEDVTARLRFFVVQRAFREWCYEKEHRPGWADRPLRVPLF